MKKNYKIFLFTCLAAPILASPSWSNEHVELQDELAEMEMFFDADQLVEVTTRNPKPLSQVAENVTIITAEEIEAMNAHTVAEVLNRVPGIIMDGNYTDFGSRSTIFIHGSDYEHVLVLVDGMRWSYVSFDYPETLTIPVQIIKRIEVVKGAASSTWGSSLGGVVNIITKDTGENTKPVGTISGSYGENSTMDLRGEAAGKAGPLSYYLYGGKQKSDGIRDTRFFDGHNLYTKLSMSLLGGSNIRASIGYSEPEYKYYYLSQWDDEGVINDRTFHATVDFSAPINNNYGLNLSAYKFEDTLTDNWQFISTSTPYNKFEYEGKATGANARLVRTGDMQTIVLGGEIERRENTTYDRIWSYSAPTTYEEIWAVFINDTIRFDKLTITPGLRYDNLSITNNEISPSLGLTYQLNDSTLLRGNASRGFRKPVPSHKSGDPYFYITNPNLESETIWSFQLGMETTALPFLHLKTTLFDHQAGDVWVRDPDSWAFVNDGSYKRQGFEISLKTESYYNVSLSANGMYLRMMPDNLDNSTHYVGNILLEYNDNTWDAQISGHYLELGDVAPPSTWEKKTGNFIWDAVVTRTFSLNEGLSAHIFAALHNIFNEEQYSVSLIPNNVRWFEAGVRLKF